MRDVPHAPGLLILDNDETTGSYCILFHLYDLFASTDFGKKLDAAMTLTLLAKCFKSFGIFRPGLVRFLRVAAHLKLADKLDAIIIYTNQLDIRQIKDAPIWKPQGTEWSIPMMIHIMLVYLADYPELIDQILTRPLDNAAIKIENYPVKDFVRAYRSIYPTGPINLEKTLFVDDLAIQPYLVDSSKSMTDVNSRIHLTPYSRKIWPGLFRNILRQIFIAHDIIPSAKDQVVIQAAEVRWVAANEKIVDSNLDYGIDLIIPVLKKVFN
jgi:hypothetical protein